jgi:DNA-binding NtrC family response regulator
VVRVIACGDGDTVTECEQKLDVEIVVVTAAGVREVNAVDGSRVCDVISKPIDVRRLVDIVSSVSAAPQASSRQ